MSSELNKGSMMSVKKKMYTWLCLAVSMTVQTIVSVNLVQNGSFENGLQGWQKSGNVQVQNKVALFQPTENQTARLTQVITGLQPQKAYTFSAQFKGVPEVPPTMCVNKGPQHDKCYSYLDIEDKDKWKENKFVFYTDANATSVEIELSVYQNDQGAVGEFTNVQVTQGDSTQSEMVVKQEMQLPAPGGNLIRNGDFSQGKQGWVVDGLITHGSNSLSLKAEPDITSRAVQEIPFKLAPNTQYTLSFDSQLAGKPGAGVFLIYKVGKDEKVLVSQAVGESKRYTIPFITPVQYPSDLKIVLENYKGQPGTVTFSNVHLEATGKEWSDTPSVVPQKIVQPLKTTFDKGLNPDEWLVVNKQWGGDNGGVIPQNVNICNGILELEGHGDLYIGPIANEEGRKTRVGAAVATKEYYASGYYEVEAQIPPHLGAVTAFWVFHYVDRQKGEPNPIRNTEIDWEMPTDMVDAAGKLTPISFRYARANSWGGQLGGEGGEYSGRIDFGFTIADGKWHKFGIDWYSGQDYPDGTRKPGYVAWYLDGKEVHRYTGKSFGQDNVPYRAGRFWIGIWFPVGEKPFRGKYIGWAGDPNFDTALLKIRSVTIIPKPAPRDMWQAESKPTGYFASLDEYPKQQTGDCSPKKVIEAQKVHVKPAKLEPIPANLPQPAPGDNLIFNSDFSKGTQGWVLDGQARIENGSIFLTSTHDVTSKAIQVLPYQLAPNITYTLAFDAGVTGSPAASVNVYYKTAGNVEKTLLHVPINQEMRHYAAQFTTPAEAIADVKVIVENYKQSNGTVEIKNINLPAMG